MHLLDRCWGLDCFLLDILDIFQHKCTKNVRKQRSSPQLIPENARQYELPQTSPSMLSTESWERHVCARPHSWLREKVAHTIESVSTVDGSQCAVSTSTWVTKRERRWSWGRFSCYINTGTDREGKCFSWMRQRARPACLHSTQASRLSRFLQLGFDSPGVWVGFVQWTAVLSKCPS